jgi:hypothetical protein
MLYFVLQVRKSYCRKTARLKKTLLILFSIAIDLRVTVSITIEEYAKSMSFSKVVFMGNSLISVDFKVQFYFHRSV